jgi:hypothetical protein
MSVSQGVLDYQTYITDLLRTYFRDSQLDVIPEWRTEFDQGLYSPRVDIAVGPFAIEDGVHLGDEFTNLFFRYEDLVRDLISFHLQNVRTVLDSGEVFENLLETNFNARCFIAIEIEKSGSRKHLMGDAVNASALGRVGIALGWNENRLRAFLNLRRYFLYLARVKKNTFNLANLLILHQEQLLEAVHQALAKNG